MWVQKEAGRNVNKIMKMYQHLYLGTLLACMYIAGIHTRGRIFWEYSGLKQSKVKTGPFHTWTHLPTVFNLNVMIVVKFGIPFPI